MTTGSRVRMLHSSAFWALMGDLLPMLAAMLVAPSLLTTLGAERMGVLSLIWVFVGYFSFLDLGLGRAVTVAVAAITDESQRSRREREITGTALCALLGLGSTGAIVLALVIYFQTIPLHLSSPELTTEVRTAALWILPSLPLLLASAALRGYFEGIGAFRNLNLVRIPTGIMLIVAPFLAAQITPNIGWAAISILLVRVTHFMALIKQLAAAQKMGTQSLLRKMAVAFDLPLFKHLLSFGGWMTLSSVLGPLIVYTDRFLIGVLVGAGAVSLYAIPFDVVSRLPILIASLCSVLLPELVRISTMVASGHSHTEEWKEVLHRAGLLTSAIVGVGTAFGWFILPTFIAWWMGSAFAAEAAGIAQVLLLAFAVNAMTQVPYLGLLSLRQTKTIAMIHLAEILPYATLLWWGTHTYGLLGAAWCCVGRGVIDYALMALACKNATMHPPPITIS